MNQEIETKQEATITVVPDAPPSDVALRINEVADYNNLLPMEGTKVEVTETPSVSHSESSVKEVQETGPADNQVNPPEVEEPSTTKVNVPAEESPLGTEVKVSLESEAEALVKRENRSVQYNVLRDNSVNAQLQHRHDAVRAILDNQNIDLVNIPVAPASDDILLTKAINDIGIAATNPSTFVMALKSGYRAELTALTNNEKIRFYNVSGSIVEQTERALRMVYEKIVSTSIGRPISFDQWLRVTAENDYETLVYGIYAASFPGETEYTIDCPKCNTRNVVKVTPAMLIEVLDTEATSTYIKEFLEGYGKGEEFLKNSELGKVARICLPSSKVIVDIGCSSLHDMLTNYHAILKLEKTYEASLVSLLKYIKRLLVPNMEALKNGRLEYLEVTDPVQRARVIGKVISGEDMTELRREIVKAETRNTVDYRIPKFRCRNASCNHEIDASVDLTQLVFTGIGGEVTGALA